MCILKLTSVSHSSLLRAFGSVAHSSPAWSSRRCNKESDSSSIEDTGQAYVVGKAVDLCTLGLFDFT